MNTFNQKIIKNWILFKKTKIYTFKKIKLFKKKIKIFKKKIKLFKKKIKLIRKKIKLIKNKIKLFRNKIKLIRNKNLIQKIIFCKIKLNIFKEDHKGKIIFIS